MRPETSTQQQPARHAAPANDEPSLPLAVDLDGTLLLTDTLFEAAAEHMRRRPFWTLWQLVQLPFAIAKIKARLQRGATLDVATLPVNEQVLAYCRRAKAIGRKVWLVSAADQETVQAIAARFGLFDRAIGSDGARNNKGAAKAELLTKEAPEGFEYVGDSPADLKVWAKAAAASHVGGGEKRTQAIE
jgi:phosphoserine phosphatase